MKELQVEHTVGVHERYCLLLNHPLLATKGGPQASNTEAGRDGGRMSNEGLMRA